MASRVLLHRSVKDIGNIYCVCARLMSTKPPPFHTSRFEDRLPDTITPDSFSVSEEERIANLYKPKPGHIQVPKTENVGVVSGVPEEHIKTRLVRIHQPPKNSMQSGTHNIHYWQIDFDTRERWENPLIGWCSTGDPMSNVTVGFSSAEEAIEHCEKMGWKYYVQKPNKREPKPRTYGANFSWNKRTRVSTK